MNAQKGYYDYDVMVSFREVFKDNYTHIQDQLLALEQQPENMSYLSQLRSDINAMGTDLQTLQMHPIAQLTVALEVFLAKIAQGEFKFDYRVSDVILMTSHHIRELFEAEFSGKDYDLTVLDKIHNTLAQLGQPSLAAHRDISLLLGLIDPHYPSDAQTQPNVQSDMGFLEGLITYIEDRSPYTKGKSRRIYRIAQAMNEAAGRPITPEQLKIAVYMHDIGMVFLPLDFETRQQKLTQQEKEDLKNHPILGGRFLDYMRLWPRAADIVRQHHERVDGKGYPYGLKAAQIDEGAKILAIADTYDAMTHKRAHRDFKRPLLRVITEINNESGLQFDAFWVGIFNEVIRKGNSGNVLY